MSLASGTRLGPYEITAAIGKGGMGEVYRAHDTALNRDVAIKVLPESLAGDPDRLMRFEREAQALAALNCPNIAQIYGLERSGPTPAIVMELVGGEDLSVRIQRGPIPLAETLPLARQIADALSAAHEAGIIHRDLKPANIKVTDDGTVKVLDFGVAKALDSGTTPGTSEAANSPTLTNRATQLGVILGTAAYMAPEQARGKAVDKRADIWAFGVVLYEMLTGRRPFDGADVTDVLAAVVRAEPDWDALPKDAPPLIRRLVHRCLIKDAKQRLHDVADARLDVEEVMNSRLSGMGETAGHRAAVPPTRRLTTLAVLTVGGLACVAAGAVVGQALWRGDTSSPAVPVSFTVPLPSGLALGQQAGTLTQTSRPQMAVSPDGSRVVFRAHSTATGLLYLRDLGSTTVQAVAGTDGASYPSWSPDSSHIAFCKDGELKHMPAAGGAAQVLGRCDNSRTAAAWAGTDALLAAPVYQGPLRVRVNGQWQDALPGVYSTETCYYVTPAWLPDAEHYLVKWSLMLDAKARVCEGLYVGALGSQDVALLVSGPVEGVAVVDDGIVFLRAGELTWQGLDPVRRTLTGAPHVIANDVVTFSAAANTVAYAARTGVKPHRFSVGNRIALYGRDGSGPTFIGGLARTATRASHRMTVRFSWLDWKQADA